MPMNIKALRVEKGWTQAELATRAETHISAIGHWERGLRVPTAENARKMADALGCTLDDIFAQPRQGAKRTGQQK